MVRILPKDYHFYAIEWRSIECAEDEPPGGIALPCCISLANKFGQFGKIEPVKFAFKPLFPLLVYPYFHK